MSENENRQETDPRMASSTGDPPIRRKKEDRLNRARFAEALAEQIASAPGSGGVVFGLLGPYGSGKTSILNMVEETLKETSEDPAVLWFNPWLFSGTEQFMDVGAHRKVRWAVLDFLRKIEDPEVQALKVRMVMPRVDNLSARLNLATMVGHREGIGRGLVLEEEAHNLEKLVLTALEHADPDSLARERDLVRLLIGAREIDRARGAALCARLAEKDSVF
jgi:ATPase subunit of ABC transporter with duplicated ATPase domains